jgi:hypothetical protein
MYSWEPGNRVWWRANGSKNVSDRDAKYAAVVRKICPMRITIEFAWQPFGKNSGGWVREITSVKSESLSPRSSLCEHLGECEAANA